MERAAVRERVRALLAHCDPATAEPAEFWGAQFDHGLAWVAFPEGLGGFGLSPALQPLVDEELRAAGAPANWARNPIGIGVAGPALVAHGTPEQARRHLRPVFTCAEVWCQLYSEPDAGSDLAGLETAAVRDGMEWVVDGRKTWITLAHAARWGLLLARTGSDQPRHRGITCFVVDMADPGVEIRPIRQLTGQAEFDDVRLRGVRVPDSDRVGDVGEGWAVAMSTLGQERAAIGGLVTTRGPQAMAEAIRLWRERPDQDPVLLDRLMELWVETQVTQLTSRRALEMVERGTPGPEAAVAKLAAAELNQRIHELSLTLMGPAGLLYDSYAMSQPEETGTALSDPARAFLRSRAATIEAGTSEILRTVLAERVLGLPPY